MKKPQVLKFWKALDGSTSEKEVISVFKHKKGYASESTLRRYAQIHSGFSQNLSSGELAKKVGWSLDLLNKIRDWWESEFGGGKPRPDIEEKHGPERGQDLGPHQRNLFYFGQRFRDRLFLETPPDVVPAGEQKSARPIWSGTPTREGYPLPRDAEETGVEQEWGPSRCDAEEHSLFPFFAEHLHGHECWKLLEQVREAVNAYREASLQAYDAVNTPVRSRLPGEIASDVEGLTRSLLVDAWFQAIGLAPINLDYTPASSLDGKGWCLRLDRWIVGNKSDPQALEPLADAHKVLDADIPGWDTTRSLGKAYQACRQVQASFQKALSPDDRLRKLLREGHCELCP